VSFLIQAPHTTRSGCLALSAMDFDNASASGMSEVMVTLALSYLFHFPAASMSIPGVVRNVFGEVLGSLGGVLRYLGCLMEVLGW
jgi:hypothetical protein